MSGVQTYDGTITRRPATRYDLDFLFRVYASTRPDIDLLPLNDEQKRDFCYRQFSAQHEHYHKYFTDAEFDIVLLDDQPVGRVYIYASEFEVRVIDISLLPEYRSRGIGTAVMQGVIDLAATKNKPLRLRVEKANPARSWYESIGFRVVKDEGIYTHMELPVAH